MKHFVFFFGLLTISILQSQTLPSEMHFSGGTHMLTLGSLPNKGLYDQSQIKKIYLNFSQPNFWAKLDSNYWAWTQQEIPATMIVDGITYDSVGVRFRGQSSFQQIPSSQKKPFGISTDYIRSNQNLMGYNKLNLNNCYDDESFIREIFYQHQIKHHIPVAKSAYTRLYINGQDWGLYPNVQQINKDFYREWFLSNKGTNWRADRPGGQVTPYGDGTGGLNYLGTDTTLYKAQYTLKSTEQTQPWFDLINTCDVLNNTSLALLPSLLPSELDIDRTLWFLASEILFSDDDSYVQKGRMDYFVYREKETGRITPQEYDGNTVMNPSYQNWSPFYHQDSVNYPLMNKLFAIPEYRQRYLAHLRTLIDEYFTPSTANAIIDSYKNHIDTTVQDDPKKIYTYTQFQNEITVLKNFISSRRNYLNSNSEVLEVAPTFSTTAFYTNGNQWITPTPLQNTTVRSKVSSASGINQMNMYYSNMLVGNFTKVQMFDDGTHDDLGINDGVYGATIPGQTAGIWIRFYVEAMANNPAKSVSYDPPGAEHNVYAYRISPFTSSDTSVVINEIMPANVSTAMDNAGQYDDWIELFNKSSQQVDISSYVLTDNATNLHKWTFPTNSKIPANGYLIVWADEDGSQGPLHANFKLSATGEELFLLDPTGKLVDSTSWTSQIFPDKSYARFPNGYGNFTIQNPTYNTNNNLVSIEETSNDNEIVVFPNPANNNLRVAVNTILNQELVIINSLGQTVYKNNFTGKLSIDVSTFKSGLYFVQCYSSDGTNKFPSKKVTIFH